MKQAVGVAVVGRIQHISDSDSKMKHFTNYCCAVFIKN